ncbi:hypothetical protein [Bacillus sp. SA1-12]|uniref:hypothetical protein n=1 Tax=Bacillus sp. SA1-12 TaxID=1455638 RepID=UPI0012E017F5|nr:hypothetical protein [Bacillus sp. SA1-12]
MIQSHEVDGTRSAMMKDAVEKSSVLANDILNAIHKVLTGLEVYPERMKSNLELTGGLINAEAVMMKLANMIGRQVAHEVVHDAAHQVGQNGSKITFFDVLSKDPRVVEHLSSTEIKMFLDPSTYNGLSAEIARKVSSRAYAVANVNRC